MFLTTLLVTLASNKATKTETKAEIEKKQDAKCREQLLTGLASIKFR